MELEIQAQWKLLVLGYNRGLNFRELTGRPAVKGA